MPRPAPVLCQVVGCTVPLANLRTYFLRQRICEEHARADAVPDGQGGWCRFCQQCTKLEPLDAFEGKKHSCRASLLKRHHRHRRQSGRPGGGSAQQQRSSSSGEGQPPGPGSTSLQLGTSPSLAPGHTAVPELSHAAAAAAGLSDAAAGPQAPSLQAGNAAGQDASLAEILARLAAGAAGQGEPLPTSGQAVDLASILAAHPALAMQAGANSQQGQLPGLLEQLCAASAAAATAAVKAAAVGNALLGTLCSRGGGSNGARELLLGQLVLQDLQLLQRMQDNVMLQLRSVQAARSLASLAAAQLPPQQQLAPPASGGPTPSITPALLDGEAAAQGPLAQLVLMLQRAAQVQPQPQAPDVQSWAPLVPPAQQQQLQQQPPPQQQQQHEQQQPAAVAIPARQSSDPGSLQLQQVLAALQQPPGVTAGSGGSSGDSGQQPMGAAAGGPPGLEAQLQAALVQLRNAGQDAAVEPPSLYSDAGGAGARTGAGDPAGGSSPTSASKAVQGAGPAAMQQGGAARAGGLTAATPDAGQPQPP